MGNFLILVKDHLASSIRTKKGIILLLLYLAVFALVAYGFFQVHNLINKELNSRGISEEQRTFVIFFAENALRQSNAVQEFVDFLLRVPFINIALFLVTLIGTPFLILLLSYDKISQEVYDGTLRYLLFRTSRLKIYLAKFLSAAIEIGVITFIALLIALVWGSFKLNNFDFSESFGYGMRFWLIAQPFLWISIAFVLIFSSLFRKPFHALLCSCLGLLGLAILPHWVDYVSPFDSFYLKGLFVNFSPKLYLSLGFFCFFAALFLGIGFSIFNKKDL
jgi:ABC-type transport system involved in multi-copper enzyme maturation permease subunit